MRNDDPAVPDTADELAAALLSAPLLVGLDDGILRLLTVASEIVSIRAGDVVLREGDPGDAFYLVRSGLFEVVTGADHTRVRLLRSGAAFGELALLAGEPRTATVRAVRDGAVWRLSRVAFDAALDRDPAFARSMVQALTRLIFESRPRAHAQPVSLSVLAIVPLDAELALSPLVDAFVAELAPARVHVQHEPPAARAEGWPRTVEALEQENEFVVLVASQPHGAWTDFCAREADRTVAVADLDRSRYRGPVPVRSELVLFGAPRRGVVTEMLSMLTPRAHYLVGTNDEAAIARAIRRITGRATGIVLSGGGARAFAHLGVLEVFQSAGLTIDRYGGTSMGALVGALAARGYTPRRSMQLLRAELVDRRPFSDYGIPRVSLIRARRARAMLERLLGEGPIEDLPLDFFCVSADLVSAETVVHRSGPLVDGVGASMSLPGLTPPVRRGDQLLVDGGVLDNLPVDAMLATGDGPVIAVDVLARGAPGARRRRRGAGGNPPMPSLLETVARSTTLASRRQAEEQHTRASARIQPDLQGVGLLGRVHRTRTHDLTEANGKIGARAG